MKKFNPKLLLIVIFTVGIFIFISYILFDIYSLVNQSLNSSEINLNLNSVEVVNTPDERQQGLMNRDELCQRCGMFFEFEREQILTFWMKDTFIPLDIIYLDNDYRIINIHKETKTNQVLEIYPSFGPSKYVLEVNSGYSDEFNLESGDKIIIKGVND